MIIFLLCVRKQWFSNKCSISGFEIPVIQPCSAPAYLHKNISDPLIFIQVFNQSQFHLGNTVNPMKLANKESMVIAEVNIGFELDSNVIMDSKAACLLGMAKQAGKKKLYGNKQVFKHAAFIKPKTNNYNPYHSKKLPVICGREFYWKFQIAYTVKSAISLYMCSLAFGIVVIISISTYYCLSC